MVENTFKYLILRIWWQLRLPLCMGLYSAITWHNAQHHTTPTDKFVCWAMANRQTHVNKKKINVESNSAVVSSQNSNTHAHWLSLCPMLNQLDFETINSRTRGTKARYCFFSLVFSHVTRYNVHDNYLMPVCRIVCKLFFFSFLLFHQSEYTSRHNNQQRQVLLYETRVHQHIFFFCIYIETILFWT